MDFPDHTEIISEINDLKMNYDFKFSLCPSFRLLVGLRSLMNMPNLEDTWLQIMWTPAIEFIIIPSPPTSVSMELIDQLKQEYSGRLLEPELISNILGTIERYYFHRYPENAGGSSEDASAGTSTSIDHFPVTLFSSGQFRIMERLGKGGFGKVYRCEGLLDEMTYAIKQVPYTSEEYPTSIREVLVLSKLNHPSIVRFYQTWSEDHVRVLAPPSSSDEEYGSELRALYILMEFCPMRLQDRIHDGLSTADGELLMREIMEGLVYIHSQDVIHRDLSRDNIFIDACGRAKIGDFGLATFFHGDRIASSRAGDRSASSRAGNRIYIAPEMLSPNPIITPEIDIYAVGLIFLELIFPMDTKSERREVLKKAKKGEFPPEIAESHKELLMLLLRKNPVDRPCAAEVLATLPSYCSSL